MGIFSKRKPMGGGLMDVIRCDEPDYLIWKWHPEKTDIRNNRKENSIRWGSTLRVKDGSVAVFVYKQPSGIMQDYIEGPFDSTLNTKNLPIIARIIGSAYDGNSPFPAEIYFINLAKIIQIKFAIPFFDVYDPRFLDFGIPVAARGTISFHINNYKNFIKLHRLDEFSLEDFQNQIRDAITKYVKTAIANAPAEKSIPVLQLEREIENISNTVESTIKERVEEDFGINIPRIDLSVIEIDKSSNGYRQLMAVTRDLTSATMQAQTAINIKEMQDAQKLSVMERQAKIEEMQYGLHKKTQSDNLSAYQTEVAGQVGVASAEGLGQMSQNSGSGANISSGNGSIGFNPAGMMAGMAIGSAIGKNLAETMDGIMKGMNPLHSTSHNPTAESNDDKSSESNQDHKKHDIE